MAKRKRLTPAVFSETLSVDPQPRSSGPLSAPPIANVAADAATQAALSDVVETLSKARREGRMVLELDPTTIDPAYLMRDRTRVDEAEMAVLTASIEARGQQTPIEVTDLGQGRYGLISGWRRLAALKRLAAAGTPRPVLALLRQPEDAPQAYLAMIEENEIRVGLSYYERARIVSKAVAGQVFEREKDALQSLFRSASRAKRSKIKSFLPLVAQLDGILHFPEDLGERLGLVLSKALEEDPALVGRLQAVLDPEPEDAAAEQALISAVLEPAPPISAPTEDKASTRQSALNSRELAPGLKATNRADGSLVLSGPALTDDLLADLQAWLSTRAAADAS